MNSLCRNRDRIRLGVIMPLFLLVVGSLTYPVYQATANQDMRGPQAHLTGESSFIDVQQEYDSGNSTPQQGLWYAWVNTGSSHVILLAAAFWSEGGPSWGGVPLPSPVSLILGQHINTTLGEVFIANTPTFMEIYNDSNANGVPDSDFDHGVSEILYYIIWNASRSFSATAAVKQIDGNSVAHYRWSVRYSGIQSILEHPFTDRFEQYPLISAYIDYVQCSYYYYYYIQGNKSYLKTGFEVSPLSDLLTLKLVGEQYQLVPAYLSLKGLSLSILYSTSIASTYPSYQVTVEGGAYNSSATSEPITPVDNAEIQLGSETVYNFVYNENYTLTKNGISNTYTSKGSACGDVSVLSPYILANGGPCLFLRWSETAKVLEDLVPRISERLQLGSILKQDSSFFYRVSFPTWGNGTLISDPTYIANLNPLSLSQGEPRDLPIVVFAAAVGLGIVMLAAALVQRKRRPNPRQ